MITILHGKRFALCVLVGYPEYLPGLLKKMEAFTIEEPVMPGDLERLKHELQRDKSERSRNEPPPPPLDVKTGRTAYKETTSADGKSKTIIINSVVADRPGQIAVSMPDGPVDPSVLQFIAMVQRSHTAK